MRTLRKLALAVIAMTLATVHAFADARTTTFAVVRNDARIGTSTVSIADIGPETTIASATHVAVKLAFLTLYHFDQNETEQWASGRWQSMSATTDDNGTVHQIVARSSADSIIVQDNGAERRIAAPAIPASLWNEAILTQSSALDPLNGRIVPVKVVDRGEEAVIIAGKPMRARHFRITTLFVQDVWYDQNHQLVQVELTGRDGSTIRYQRV
jgi:hypothetical protein